MTEVAGEVCDGFFVHPFTTRRYVDEVTMPALRRGRAAGAATPDAFVVCGMPMVAIGRDDAELARAVRDTKRQIAFYASTPAYRAVLGLHGRGEMHAELARLARRGRWDEMADVVDDEMLTLVAAVGDPAEVAADVLRRWGDRFDRLVLYASGGGDPSLLASAAAAVRGSSR